MTKRETILAAVKTALTGTTGVSTRIYRSRTEALKRDEHPALVIEPIQDLPTRTAIGRLTWELSFAITAVIRAEEPDSNGDAIVEDIHSKVMNDTALNNMLVDLVPGNTDFQFVDADAPLGIISMQYKATYQTAETNLAST